jgi:hypothetical protein
MLRLKALIDLIEVVAPMGAAHAEITSDTFGLEHVKRTYCEG